MPNAAILWPIHFGATSYVLRVTADGGTQDLPFPAVGSLSTTTPYYMSGDGAADDLITIIDAALTAHVNINTCAIVYTANDYLQFTFTTTALGSNTVQILWSHANTTLDPAIFGFADASTAAALVITGTLVPHGLVNFERPPSTDSRDRTPVVGGAAISISGIVRTSRFTTSTPTRDFTFDLLHQRKALIEYADADEPTANVEYMWLNALSLGRTVRYCADRTNLASYESYRWRPPLADPLQRSDQFILRWRAQLNLQGV